MTPRRTTKALSLQPVAGARFQPTGFPDLGAAVFDSPDGQGGWVPSLHVESPQSMANRFELTTWDHAAKDQPPALTGLPYVRVLNEDGEVLTSSRVEAHRLASAYIMQGAIEGEPAEEWVCGRLGLRKDAAIDHQRLAQAVCALDPLSLIHGVFFARKAWPWQPKIARALTSFIDADDVREAVSGGVKTDSVNIAGGNTDSGYGMVPHQRVEYTAQRITAYVTIDHEQLRSYGLGDAGVELLEAIIGYELSSFFNPEGVRLRTACDLKLATSVDEAFGTSEEAELRLRAAIENASELLGPVTDVIWSGRPEKPKK